MGGQQIQAKLVKRKSSNHPVVMLKKENKTVKTEHKIIHGDCVKELKKISSESIDLIVTDPPFNIGKKYNSYADKRSKADYLSWCQSWLLECVRILKNEGSLYLFNYPENNAHLMPFLEEHLTFKRWMTWHYPTNTGMSPTNFTRTQHSILFFIKGKKPKTFNKNDIAEPYRNPTDKRIQERIRNGSKGKTPYDVFHFNLVKNVSKDKTLHPCQIPVQLIELLLKRVQIKRILFWILLGAVFQLLTPVKSWIETA